MSTVHVCCVVLSSWKIDFPFNQEFWYKFPGIPSDKWNNIIQNFHKKVQSCKVLLVHLIFLLEFLVRCFAYWKLNNLGFSGNFSPTPKKCLYHLSHFQNFQHFWLNGKCSQSALLWFRCHWEKFDHGHFNLEVKHCSTRSWLTNQLNICSKYNYPYFIIIVIFLANVPCVYDKY